ncbi:MAG TPA: TlpA disulfide reductase family protein [Gemmataceae bacterium]|nr:TlpA disulfide reductase family protein [Gemmataceae bacterium]
MMYSRSTWRLLVVIGLVILGAATAAGLFANAGPNQDPATQPPAPAEVTLKPIKYQQLIDAVKAQKGNVVVVDVWATYCAPCKKEFPSFVKLHERRAKDGVVCISVCVDSKDLQGEALKYLKKQNATSTNYWLDEEPDLWAGKWKVKKGVPLAFVFDRQGKIAKKFDNENDKADPFTYDDVNKVVDGLLKPGF